MPACIGTLPRRSGRAKVVDLTALAFTQGYLGFQESDRVVRHTVGATDARVAVG